VEVIFSMNGVAHVCVCVCVFESELREWQARKISLYIIIVGFLSRDASVCEYLLISLRNTIWAAEK